jgi:hypothetical protein
MSKSWIDVLREEGRILVVNVPPKFEVAVMPQSTAPLYIVSDR